VLFNGIKDKRSSKVLQVAKNISALYRSGYKMFSEDLDSKPPPFFTEA